MCVRRVDQDADSAWAITSDHGEFHGDDGSTAPGSRRLGWAWFDAGHNELLRDTGCVVDDDVRHSLNSADVPDATLQQLAADADDLWPAPWRDAISDCVERRALIGTPIAAYVPDKLVNGRLALVGDAAHVPTPMTGSGFSASLDDAVAIAESVAAGVYGSQPEKALRVRRQAAEQCPSHGLVGTAVQPVLHGATFQSPVRLTPADLEQGEHCCRRPRRYVRVGQAYRAGSGAWFPPQW